VAYHLQHRYVLNSVTIGIAGGQVHIKKPRRLDEAAHKMRLVISMTERACEATGIAIAGLLSRAIIGFGKSNNSLVKLA